jgi:sulfide:quinone oxidoreductase
MTREFQTSRRAFLTLAAAGGAAAALPGEAVQAQAVPTNARIVIIGAGAAGTALVNRLVDRLEGAQITLIDPRVEHLYQPGLTLVAAGLKPPSYAVSQTTDWLPDGVTLIPARVAAVDPEAQTVSTEGGETLDYDFLVVAPGLILDHDAIEGFSLDMVGENGIGALYAGPDYAARTWHAASRFIEEGGRGVFTRPATEMKCAGAPLKHTFLIDDRLTRAEARGTARIDYIAPQSSLFGVPIVAERVRMLLTSATSITLTGGRSAASTPGRRSPHSPMPTGSPTTRSTTTSTSSRRSAHPSSCASRVWPGPTGGPTRAGSIATQPPCATTATPTSGPWATWRACRRARRRRA